MENRRKKKKQKKNQVITRYKFWCKFLSNYHFHIMNFLTLTMQLQPTVDRW